MLKRKSEQRALARGRSLNRRQYRPLVKPQVGDRVCYCGPYGSSGIDDPFRAVIVKVRAGRALVDWGGAYPARWCAIRNLRQAPRQG